jgi:isopenicillin-N N-acyltransferase-like protein
MNRKCAGLVGCFFTFFLIMGGVSRAEIVARCGQGYLETIDGYRVLHLKGTPYEMGFQQGTLLNDDCKSLFTYLFDGKLKEKKIEYLGIQVPVKQAVAAIFAVQRPNIPERYIEEMQGIADALHIDAQTVFAANSIPEFFHCSGFALLGEITQHGTLLHGRVLDYGVDWKLQEHAVLVVAQPEGRIPFVNVTFAGFIGSVSGMNNQQVSIGEMGGSGQGKWAGSPMAFLVRRVLEEARTLDDAIQIFKTSKRTCEYYYVVADAKSNSAVGLDGSADRFTVVHPGESHPELPTPIPHTVLMSQGDRYKNLCRTTQGILNEHEKFSVERAIHLMDAPVAMKSNLHNVLFAPGIGKLWVANASSDNKPAWTQKYYEFDFRALLEQPFPTTGKEYPVRLHSETAFHNGTPDIRQNSSLDR